MVSRTAAPARSGRWPLSKRSTLLLVLLVLGFTGLRGLHALTPAAKDAGLGTAKVVVVGLSGHQQLSDHDRALLESHLDSAQAGAVSVRPRYLGSCAAAGWATLGAGRRTSVAGLCDPQVQDGHVLDWSRYQAAAAARLGDAHLGTLAEAATGCVAAVGPGAGLAAARPDGSLAAFDTPAGFLARGARPACPVTLVDAGPQSDAITDRLVRQPDVTLVVLGVGPAAGSADPGLQVIYRLGAATPGWMTSPSTRRSGVVTLPDVTASLVALGQHEATRGREPVDGSPLQVDKAALSVSAIESRLAAVAALSDVAPVGYATTGILGALAVVLMLLGVALRRLALTRTLLAFATVLGAVMMLPGAVNWAESGSPGLVLSLLVLGWALILTSTVLLVSEATGVPVAVASAALVVAAVTVDAALGGVLQPGSLLNSRPIYGLRWYGFGNVTFSAFAAAGLLLAGYLAARLQREGHRWAGVAAAAVVGFGVVLCEGWPSMGADFGGVVALTPGVCWLVLDLADVRVTRGRLLAVAATAVAAAAAISWLDWRRGPGSRSHLGAFVQRILDGDADSIVARKAVAAAETIASPIGVVSLVVGIGIWVLLFRLLVPRLAGQFRTLDPVAVALLATAVLGTLLNDGGIFVWLTITSAFALSVASLSCDRVIDQQRRAGLAGANR